MQQQHYQEYAQTVVGEMALNVHVEMKDVAFQGKTRETFVVTALNIRNHPATVNGIPVTYAVHAELDPDGWRITHQWVRRAEGGEGTMNQFIKIREAVLVELHRIALEPVTLAKVRLASAKVAQEKQEDEITRITETLAEAFETLDELKRRVTHRQTALDQQELVGSGEMHPLPCEIAYHWHGGGGSALYSFASCGGKVHNARHREQLEEEIDGNIDDLSAEHEALLTKGLTQPLTNEEAERVETIVKDKVHLETLFAYCAAQHPG